MARKAKPTVMKTKPTKTVGAPAKPARPEDFEERVRQRAYELWEASGCPQGFDAEHWLQAEREVSALYARHSAG
jgi:hypothetical protein